MTAKFVAVKCLLYQGVFPSERYFEVTLADGEKHKGIAPRYFCWNSQNRIVTEEEQTDGSQGLIAAKLLKKKGIPEGIFVVEVPDGAFLAVAKDQVSERPTKIIPPGQSDDDEMEISDVSHRSRP